jgi:hypothetical protein
MSGPRATWVKAAALAAAACVLMVAPVLAGPAYHAPAPQIVTLHPVLLPAAFGGSPPVSFVVSVAPAPRPAPAPFAVAIRGPDGQVRRFAVEGGRAAIQAPPVVVLHPGESVTVQLRATR